MFDWGFQSEDEKFITSDGIYLCRGKVRAVVYGQCIRVAIYRPDGVAIVQEFWAPCCHNEAFRLIYSCDRRRHCYEFSLLSLKANCMMRKPLTTSIALPISHHNRSRWRR